MVPCRTHTGTHRHTGTGAETAVCDLWPLSSVRGGAGHSQRHSITSSVSAPVITADVLMGQNYGIKSPTATALSVKKMPPNEVCD